MLDTGKPGYSTTEGKGVGLMKPIRKIRYAIITREVSYKRGTIGVARKTFMLQMDLAHVAIDAFRAEMAKVFPKIQMPEVPK